MTSFGWEWLRDEETGSYKSLSDASAEKWVNPIGLALEMVKSGLGVGPETVDPNLGVGPKWEGYS